MFKIQKGVMGSITNVQIPAETVYKFGLLSTQPSARGINHGNDVIMFAKNQESHPCGVANISLISFFSLFIYWWRRWESNPRLGAEAYRHYIEPFGTSPTDHCFPL